MSKAIVFDFDGTIADSLVAATEVFNELAAEYDLNTISHDEIPNLQELSLSEFLSHIGVKRRHIPVILAKGRTLFRERVPSLKPCQGVIEQLPELRKEVNHFGILTSNSIENVEIFLRKQGLRHYFDFVSSCSKLKGKAKHLRGIARTFSLETQDMIYVGDEVRDVKAAKKAEVPIAAVCWGFNSSNALSEAAPDWLLSEPSQLAYLLDSASLENRRIRRRTQG